MIKVATAFSGGFGSVEFALKYLGIKHEVVFACEWMKPQRESYLLNHGEPTSNFYEDIRTLNGTKYKGQIDYYHLSPPCQSYSLAGSRGGAADDRGGLMFEAIKSIDEVQPKMFSVENVRGLLSSNNGEDWKNILKDFNSLKGYTVSFGIMNAKEQETPQNRERVFIVGFRGDGAKMNFPKRVPLKYKLFELLEDEVDDKYFLSEKTLSNFIKKDNDDSNPMRVQAFHGKNDEVCATITARYYKGGITDPYIKEELIQIGNIDTKGHNSLWGRVYDTNGIASTLNAQGGGAGAKTGLYKVYKDLGTIIEDGVTYSVRRLIPREAARVQGDFEDKFNLGNFSDTKLYEFIGNAMDISTTKNLITKMLRHLANVNIAEPKEPSFTISTQEKQTDLFDIMGVA